jgi:hypothetical protein
MCLIDPIGIDVTDREQGHETREAAPRPPRYHFVQDISYGSGFGLDAKFVSTAYGAA